MTDTTNKPGDTLEDNVRYLLSRCPWTVQDMSGERTGSRAKEDLAGSLAITFLGMEQTIRDFAEAITEVETASTALEGRKAWARVDDLLKRCRTRGVTACPAGWQLVPVKPTEEMARAGVDAYNAHTSAMFDRVWEAMLAAAPALRCVAVPRPVAYHDKDQPAGIAWCPGYPDGLKDITPLYAAGVLGTQGDQHG